MGEKMIKFVGKVYRHVLKKKRQRYIGKLISRGLMLGKNVEFVDTFFLDPSHCYLISIGNNCTICPNVRFVAHDASTKKKMGYTKIGKIEVGENCFIGDSSIILPNVKIGPDAIIGAGSVVTKNVPPGTIAAGNPARIITTVEEYLAKIEDISKYKKVFDKNYYIEKLDQNKRDEIISSVGDSIAFIV